jgi:hypothetical protein
LTDCDACAAPKCFYEPDEEVKVTVKAPAPDILRCAECGKIMTKLPTTATCLNTACTKAGQLIQRRPNAESEALT